MRFVRSIISSVTAAAGKLMRFSGAGRAGESFSNREYFQHYGFGSRPLPGAEAIVLLQGNQLIVVASDDRRYRIALEEGEVAVYTDEGDFVHLKRGKKIHVNCGGEVKVDAADRVVVNTGDAEVNCSGKATVTAWEGVDIDGGTDALLGIVQGACMCPFIGQPHMNVSSNVKGSY